MRLMTIAATDASVVHGTLKKRTVYVHLVEDLPITMVKTFVEQRHAMRVRQWLPVDVRRLDGHPARMAPRTGFDLGLGG